MPHITVKMWPGKTPEQKRELACRLEKDLMEVVGAPSEGISVVILDVDKPDWDREVCQKELAPNRDNIYKAPGYPFE